MNPETQDKSLKRITRADQRGLTALVVELCENHFCRFPDDPFALIWYAMAKTELAQFSQAEQAIRGAIVMWKGQRRLLALAFKQMGSLSSAKGDLKSAATWYRKAGRINPRTDVHVFLGHVEFRRGLLKQAQASYRKAIMHAASFTDEAWFNLGGVFVAQRRYKEAIKCYRKALEIDPKYGIAKRRLMDAQLALQLKNSNQ